MKLICGDSLHKLKELTENSIDAVVTDPPYGLSFMGKKWDYDVPSVELWREIYRVLKPGGHVLSFGGTRTYHRMVVNIEDAGFEIRDQVMWLYGSGFPKSHNLKDEWQGFGTALKPANEPICLARKPLEKGLTVAENVLKYGTGAINVDASRIAGEKPLRETTDGHEGLFGMGSRLAVGSTTQGRWPANVLFDEVAAEMLDAQSGDNVSRFFYVAKASKRERNAGLEGMPIKNNDTHNNPNRMFSAEAGVEMDKSTKQGNQNHHPTVKPIKLMEYLITLITPPNGTVLDPFMGSGSTGVAAKNLGFNFTGIELSDEYFEIAKKRINPADQLQLEGTL